MRPPNNNTIFSYTLVASSVEFNILVSLLLGTQASISCSVGITTAPSQRISVIIVVAITSRTTVKGYIRTPHLTSPF